MRLLIYIFCFALFSSNISAQNTIRNGDLVYWRVQEHYPGMPMKLKIVLRFDTEQAIERSIYMIPPGATDSTIIGEKREVVLNEQGQPINKMTLVQGPKEARKIDSMPLLFKSLKKKQVESIIPFVEAGSNGKVDYYILEESLPDFGWKITEERKKIAQFECIKAVSKPFRGRVYEAWFAPEIPMSNGPWKFSGLPGLILEAEDQSKEIRFIFEKLILNPKEIRSTENAFANSKLPRITWEQYVKMVNDKEIKNQKAVQSQGGQIIKFDRREWEKTR
jgi:GLPGLI family protein